MSQQKSPHNPIVLTVGSLKELFVILVGLAITNGINQVVLKSTQGAPGSTYVNLWRGIISQDFILFTMLALNSVRFYHGNMRHLDTVYTGEDGKGRSGDLRFDRGTMLAVDFFIMFFQSMVFTLLSFLVSQPSTFYGLFAVLLLIDGFWFLLVHKHPPDAKVHKYQKVYYINNLFFGALMAVLTFTGWPSAAATFLTVQTAILLFNTISDFVLNWGHYFGNSDPADQKEHVN